MIQQALEASEGLSAEQVQPWMTCFTREVTRQLVTASSWELGEANFGSWILVGGTLLLTIYLLLLPLPAAFPLEFCNHFCVCASKSSRHPFFCVCIQRSVAARVCFSLFVCCGKPTSSCRWWGLEGFWSCVSCLCHPLPRWHYASMERGREREAEERRWGRGLVWWGVRETRQWRP